MKWPAIKKCWLVWSVGNDGHTRLRAVDTNEKMAAAHEKACKMDGNTARVFVEKSRLNHLYFGMFEFKAPDPKAVKKALAEARRNAKPCNSYIHHGPGHQTRSRCDLTGPHKQHVFYARELYWTGRKAYSGYFDESPEERR